MIRKKYLMFLVFLVALALSACGGSEVDATPTLSVDQIQTLAVMTYQAQETQTALALPTATPAPTNTPIPTMTIASPAATSALATTGTAVGGTGASCYGLSYVSDVTIPDNTEVTPGQSFTKTWRVSNTGTCAWEPGFVFRLVGGDAIGGSAVTLNQRVEPNTQYEFSVPMVVPSNASGELQGTWQLSDASGTSFGDGVYVLVDVTGSGSNSGGSPTETSVPATATP
jgi:uncharacterized protein affecting Mg2+/Co2+ transport